MDLALLEGTRTVVKSPGVPREAPVIAAALERGIDVVGELELAWRALPNRFVGVTGTNGKTTTVELLGHVYRSAGEPVAVAGNVGTPLSELVGAVEPDATVICECSSFQLEDTSYFAPECAVFLNLAPDHLDRHHDLESYLAAKLRIFANQGNDDLAVYNADEPELAGVDLGGCARRVAFCTGAAPDCEVAVAEGTIFYDGEPLLAVEELGLFGEHNVANAMAAAAAALSMGLDRDAVREGLRSFAGVPHRLEPVAEIEWRPLRQRLQGDQRRLRHGRPAGLRGRRARDPRRQREGRAVRAAARPDPRALRRLLPDRRQRRPHGRGAGAGGRGRRRAAPLRRPRATPSAAPPLRPGPARSSCSRPPAPASTPSRTSSSAASASARSSERCGEHLPARPRASRRPRARAKKKTRKRRGRRSRPSTTCC